MQNITWKQINDYPKYEISNTGSIRTIRHQRFIKSFVQKEGNYYNVTLCKDSQKKNFLALS
ncbi:NUMOD4 motif-containing homing endonuclease [Tetrahymena thermophila SB210]|uniref:NUMOD4 motif-containing homing endonuclease n=1 Tax=Tetrahymena thermophila (strain SB210) TaxID=312017 RepID=A0A1B9C246_TETTS|nr:NUMOD4 motif-containing homing endonuclease [Tetrahymena thermophila SB210]